MFTCEGREYWGAHMWVRLLGGGEDKVLPAIKRDTTAWEEEWS